MMSVAHILRSSLAIVLMVSACAVARAQTDYFSDTSTSQLNWASSTANGSRALHDFDRPGRLSLVGRPAGYPSPAQQAVSTGNPSDQADSFWDRFPTTPPEKPDAPPEGYESFAAIMANGFWFGSFDAFFMEPHFQGNTAVTRIAGIGRQPKAFDFGFEFIPRITFGFETNAGPGIELDLWKMNEFSDRIFFTSDAVNSGATTVLVGDVGGTTTLTATGGETIEARHQAKIYSGGINFFKSVKNPRSRIRGAIGLRFVSLRHRMVAFRRDPFGTVTCTLTNFSDFQGLGPSVGVTYRRPIGHTSLSMLGGFRGALLFGHRDQVIRNDSLLVFQQLGKDEPLTILDAFLGVEWKREMSQCRSFFVRTNFETQYWIGGGSAIDADANFGLYGFTLSLGVTR